MKTTTKTTTTVDITTLGVWGACMFVGGPCAAGFGIFNFVAGYFRNASSYSHYGDENLIGWAIMASIGTLASLLGLVFLLYGRRFYSTADTWGD